MTCNKSHTQGLAARNNLYSYFKSRPLIVPSKSNQPLYTDFAAYNLVTPNPKFQAKFFVKALTHHTISRSTFNCSSAKMGLLALPHAAQAILSCYGLCHSYQCIMKLCQYEERSKKAAKFSNTAAEQLYKTCTTRASAAIAVRFPHATPLSIQILGYDVIGNDQGTLLSLRFSLSWKNRLF